MAIANTKDNGNFALRRQDSDCTMAGYFFKCDICNENFTKFKKKPMRLPCCDGKLCSTCLKRINELDVAFHCPFCRFHHDSNKVKKFSVCRTTLQFWELLCKQCHVQLVMRNCQKCKSLCCVQCCDAESDAPVSSAAKNIKNVKIIREHLIELRKRRHSIENISQKLITMVNEVQKNTLHLLDTFFETSETALNVLTTRSANNENFDAKKFLEKNSLQPIHNSEVFLTNLLDVFASHKLHSEMNTLDQLIKIPPKISISNPLGLQEFQQLQENVEPSCSPRRTRLGVSSLVSNAKLSKSKSEGNIFQAVVMLDDVREFNSKEIPSTAEMISLQEASACSNKRRISSPAVSTSVYLGRQEIRFLPQELLTSALHCQRNPVKKMIKKLRFEHLVDQFHLPVVAWSIAMTTSGALLVGATDDFRLYVPQKENVCHEIIVPLPVICRGNCVGVAIDENHIVACVIGILFRGVVVCCLPLKLNGPGIISWTGGAKGETDSQFDTPQGITISPDGAHVFVVDQRLQRVTVHSLPSLILETVVANSNSGLQRPWGVATCYPHLYVTGAHGMAIFQVEKPYTKRTDQSHVFHDSFDVVACASWLPNLILVDSYSGLTAMQVHSINGTLMGPKIGHQVLNKAVMHSVAVLGKMIIVNFRGSTKCNIYSIQD